MSVEIIRCPNCRREYDSFIEDMATCVCPYCSKKEKNEDIKPLDKIYLEIMPFGKYRGQQFYKIPDSYLEWFEKEMITSKNKLDPKTITLLGNVTKELERRQKNPKARV